MSVFWLIIMKIYNLMNSFFEFYLPNTFFIYTQHGSNFFKPFQANGFTNPTLIET